ncbi:MAG: hypothetical protein IPO85_00340 [Saprospiraceae bacterium]|uniref:Uncharacterized protein n=1 Tax=Candidatus Defluviibacterium haderslevense TaxID=2981993 RepID=A0A9D7S5C3_9BACT|nr:hypothetical protein [Candidatus Defluviibacterium haderslevense]
MKNLLSYLIITSTLLLSIELKSQNFIPKLFGVESMQDIADESIENALVRFNSIASSLMNSLSQNVDYTSKQRVKEIALTLSNFEVFIKDQKDEFLIRANSTILSTMDRIAEELYNLQNTVTNQMSISIARLSATTRDIVGKTIFSKLEHGIDQIDGLDQIVNVEGKYKLKIIGNGFNNNLIIKIDGKVVPKNQKSISNIEVNLNISDIILNSLFKDTSIIGLPLEIIIQKKKTRKILYKFKSEITLFPKYPVIYYKFTQYINNKIFEESYPLPREEKRIESDRDYIVQFDAPPNCIFDVTKTKFLDPESEPQLPNIVFRKNGNPKYYLIGDLRNKIRSIKGEFYNSVSQEYFCSTIRMIYVDQWIRCLINKKDSKPLYFTSNKKRLSYGDHTSEFFDENNIGDYTIEVKLFYGRTIILTSTFKDSDNEVFVSNDQMTGANKRIRLTIRRPMN